jgi:DNA-binding transcriptional MerR regulator
MQETAAVARPRLRTVSEASAEVAMSARTLRYYEELGFLRPQRTAGGHRLFNDDDIEILGRIGRMQALGLTLKTISRALNYRSHRDAKTGKPHFDAETYATLAADARSDADALKLRLIELRREIETAQRELDGLEHDAAYLERRLIEQRAAEAADDGGR